MSHCQARRARFFPLTVCIIAIFAAPSFAAPKSAAARARKSTAILGLTATPNRTLLQGRYAEARILVESKASSGKTEDVSSKVTWTIADPRIAEVDSDGIVRARGDGKTLLTARLRGRAAQIPVQVRGVVKAGPPRFITDVEPILTKAGCYMGACHGAGQGKGGFKISLQGYDPEFDYEVITRANGARRISRSQPENSLLLRKPSLMVAHRGGLRLKAGSPEYRLLRDWIAEGLPGPSESDPSVLRLEVLPKTRSLAVGQTQRFIVKAHYSDGTQRDVSTQTLFTASDESVASVTPSGEAKANGPGEGAVLARYQGFVMAARVISPFAAPYAAAPAKNSTKIDQLVNNKLAALGLSPSPKSSDSDFLRRAYLDVIGLLPTPEEARTFLASKDPQKREKLIDALLARSEYVDFWSMKWGDLLRNNRRTLNDKGMYAFNNWIRRSVMENKPWDQFARELLLARGSVYANGAANYYRTARTANELAETTSQVFLGVRIQCARCHNHPYEKWKQNQYYQMAAFFARVKARNGAGENEQLVLAVNSGEVQHPKTKKDVGPCALDAAPVSASYSGDRREALAEWITSPKNPFFAKIIVNRLWRHFLGRGLVEPVDDIRVTNPASNDALMDFLAQDFVRHGYDLKYLMRAIMRSDVYQRSALPTNDNARDTKYYSHYSFKRLGAEQLMDAIASATGVPDKFDGYPLGTRAAQLPDTTVASYFLELFGRPARNITCECERVDEPNLGQVLHLMNNAGLNARLASQEGRVSKLVGKLPLRRIFWMRLPTDKKEGWKAEKQLVDELYLASVSRYPSPVESRQAVQALIISKSRHQTAEDILWALLNSKEFFFNH